MANEDSIRSQIEALNFGECYSRSEMFMLAALTNDSLANATESLSKSIGSSMRRAAANTGRIYRMHAGQWFNRDKDLILTVVVTRAS